MELQKQISFEELVVLNTLLSFEIALIVFPPLCVGQESVQNSATATFLQGAQFIQHTKIGLAVSLSNCMDNFN